MTIYDIKPLFQNLLRPLVRWMASQNCTANQVTLCTFALSVMAGILLGIFIQHHWIFWLVPVVLFIRMALNAIDGMLAREHNMKSPLGSILNELTDMLSDAAIYLPFTLLGSRQAFFVVVIVILAIISEAAGLATQQIGASRRYDGPMGKSDRAFSFSIIAILLALGITPGWWLTLIWCALIVLLLWTIFNRVYRGLKELNA